VFVHDDVHDELLKLLVQKARELRIGLPSDPETDVCPIGSIPALHSLIRGLEEALANGAELLLGGSRVNYKGEKDQLGLYLEPTILTRVDPRLAIMQEELFGPILPVTSVSDIDLAGGVIVNDDHLYFGPETTNLGGVKASGIIGTKYFAQEMTYLKYVHRG